eukprot:TRINITY_DN451_c0_g1_i1.p1 TRINITY_DN451_c0_g1~~TRINITY_DN451_c0_g1_i1.p1  ORF type:complete len:513 (-),score=66.65 TRINITY_DN451_c0_g1_i1:74-1612(-)
MGTMVDTLAHPSAEVVERMSKRWNRLDSLQKCLQELTQVDGTLRQLETLEECETVFLATLAAWERWTGDMFVSRNKDKDADKPKDFPLRDRPAASNADDAVAYFIRTHPGSFEDLFVSRPFVERLCQTPGKTWSETAAEILLANVQLKEGYLFSKTFQALNPMVALHFYAQLLQVAPKFRCGTGWPQMFINIIDEPLKAVDTLPLTPSMKDTLKAGYALKKYQTTNGEDALAPFEYARLQHAVLPDILPGDSGIVDMGTAGIAQALVVYTGLSIEQLESRLHPRSYSIIGFIKESDHVSDVILQDAQWLHQNGISRHAICDKLEELIFIAYYEYYLKLYRNAPRARDRLTPCRLDITKLLGYEPDQDTGCFSTNPQFPFELAAEYYLGSQGDPFHDSPTYPITGLGSGELRITNKQLKASYQETMVKKDAEPTTEQQPTSKQIAEQEEGQGVEEEKPLRRTLVPAYQCQIPNLALLLIRRLCFFESTSIRASPQHLATILQVQPTSTTNKNH